MKDPEVKAMIRANNPDIDVLELMKRVRSEAAKIRVSGAIEERRSGWQDDDDRRTARALDRHHHISSLLAAGEEKNVPRKQWPGRLRFLRVFGPLSSLALRIWNYLFKEQREKDTLILHAMRETIAMTAQVGDYALRLREAHRALERTRRDLVDDVAALRPLLALSERVAGLERAHHMTHERSLSSVADIERLERVLSDAGILTVSDQSTLARVAHAHERIDSAERDIHAIVARFTGIPLLADVTTRLAESERNQQLIIDRALAQALRVNALLRAELADLRRAFASSNNAAATIANAAGGDRRFDALYMAIEDRFRGTRADISDRLAMYVPLIAEAGTVTAATPLLDLGSGRGDFIRLLVEAGLPAIGVDTNEVAVAEAELLGIAVELGDIFERLRATPTASVGAVSAIHVIEHLPFPLLVELYEETLRVLVPGGLVMFETPNPENVRVATSTFYLDPTHLHPVPPSLAEFLADAIGFVEPRILRLHPPTDVDADPTLAGNVLLGLLGASQDYALVARAPSV